jgi:hypothetical protein
MGICIGTRLSDNSNLRHWTTSTSRDGFRMRADAGKTACITGKLDDAVHAPFIHVSGCGKKSIHLAVLLHSTQPSHHTQPPPPPPYTHTRLELYVYSLIYPSYLECENHQVARLVIGYAIAGLKLLLISICNSIHLSMAEPWILEVVGRNLFALL